MNYISYTVFDSRFRHITKAIYMSLSCHMRTETRVKRQRRELFISRNMIIENFKRDFLQLLQLVTIYYYDYQLARLINSHNVLTKY